MESAVRIRKSVESFYADIWNRYDKARIPELLSSNICFRGSLGLEKTGHEGFTSYLDYVHRALGQFRCDILDLVIESPKAFARMRFSGIHRGELFGYSATGKQVEWAGAALFTFAEDRIVDLWVLGDVQGVMQILGQNKLG